jgi:transposase-like protein
MKKKHQGGAPPIHDNSLKIAVARDFLTSELGTSEIARKYGLTNSQVSHFVSWYRKRYGDNVVGDLPAETIEPSQQTPKEKELKKQLADANLKVEALERLIEVARRELGIDILKKGGTKQS